MCGVNRLSIGAEIIVAFTFTRSARHVRPFGRKKKNYFAKHRMSLNNETEYLNFPLDTNLQAMRLQNFNILIIRLSNFSKF